MHKTVTTIVNNTGGVTSYACKTVTTIVDNYGVSLHMLGIQLIPLLVTRVVGGQDTTKDTNCNGPWNRSVSPSLGEQHQKTENKYLFNLIFLMYLSPTLSTIVDNCVGVTSLPCKTVTTIMDNCGGVNSFTCKTLSTIEAKCGGGVVKSAENSYQRWCLYRTSFPPAPPPYA